jgi:hypothetical protein
MSIWGFSAAYSPKEDKTMKPTWKLLSIVLVLLVLSVGGTSLILEAQAQGRQSGSRWEYAWVHLPANGAPVFTRAEREITVLPSSELLSGAVDSVQQGLRSYKIQVRSARDDSAAALDIAGQDGWEAINVVAYRDGLKVLLKRPV